MEMRALVFNGEPYCDSERQDALVKRTLEAIEKSGVSLEASELSVDRGAALFLVSDDAPRRTILSACAGGYARVVIQETAGVFLPEGERTPEAIAARFGEICDLSTAMHCEEPGGPGMRFVRQAAAAAGVSLK